MSWTQIESTAYWSLFVAAFIGVAIWESVRPGSSLSTSAERRWGNHGILFIASAIISTTLLRASPVIVAVAVVNSTHGLLNRTWLPFAVRCAAAILMLDLVKYATHRLYHSVPFLWRVHQVHHSDPDFDVSTAVRAHPIEVVLTQSAYLGMVAAMAAPPVAVLAAELLACFQSFFEHANASVPEWAEKALRRVLITPNMHRIHHSEDAGEQARNLGEIFPWWDRLFKTYLDKPAAGEEMITGLKGFQNAGSLGVTFMLAEPFKSRPEVQSRPQAQAGSGVGR